MTGTPGRMGWDVFSLLWGEMVTGALLCFLQYEEVAEKDDLMGVEDTAKKDILEPGTPLPGPDWEVAFCPGKHTQ